MDDILAILLDNNIGLAFISETWLSSQSNITTSVLKQSGYNISHNFRQKRGAGVAIIWNDSLDKQIRSCSVNSHYDTFQYQNVIFNGNFKMNLVCLYRLQETSLPLFFQELNDFLSNLNQCHPLVLTGDFNIHYEKSNSQNVIDFKNLTSAFGLSQFVLGPTNLFGHTIDLLFANNVQFQFNEIYPVNYNLGDHFPVLFELPNIEKSVSTKKQVVTYRDTKSMDIPGFAQQLGTSLNSSLNGLVENSSFCEQFNVFNNTVKGEFDKVAPWKTRTFFTSSSPPWMDNVYRAKRIVRRSLERKWKKSGLTEDKTAYVNQRKICAKMSFDKRSQYYSDLITNKKGDQRALFNIVNNVFGKNKTSVLPAHSNDIELANTFNSFYIDKVEQLRNKIPVTSDKQSEYTIFNGTPMDTFEPTNVAELQEILKESGMKTSFQDILPASILKEVIDALLPYICDLVNKSLASGSVEGMKESVVVPLLKKAGLDAEILKNYRPVHDLVFLSKLSERVVNRRLHGHMNINLLHCKYEHGYKKFHSTETLLVRLFNDILRSCDIGRITILLLIDLS